MLSLIPISNIKLDGNRGKLINITGTLRDEYNNLLTNIKLKIVIGNKTYTVITNSTGARIVRYKVTTLGKIDVKVYFEGNDTYMGSSNSTSFNVSVVPEYIPIVVPKTNNNINNHLITKAEMKKTGIPILSIFLVLLASLGILIRKR